MPQAFERATFLGSFNYSIIIHVFYSLLKSCPVEEQTILKLSLSLRERLLHITLNFTLQTIIRKKYAFM